MPSLPGDDALDPPLSLELLHGAGLDEIHAFFPLEAPAPVETPEAESEAEEVIEVIPATQIQEDEPDEIAGPREVFTLNRKGQKCEI